ncbi:MAG: DoxX family membrane protein [Deltaproteobacteria bacterium]|nr:DoxX family membrane protein [Deltaproteobacteria bacterium]
MQICSYDSRRFFLLGMRVYFGIWLLYLGLIKWFMFGASGFVNMIADQFDKTWSPHALNVSLGWLILFAEPLGALFILSGIKPRLAWGLASLLMFLLAFGQTLLMKPDVGQNWMYVFAALVCAALSDPEECCKAKS